MLADSRDALILREAGYPAVQYIPRKDVDMTLLERSAHATYCPYKGAREVTHILTRRLELRCDK